MKTDLTVVIYTPQELNHSSYIQTGLFELEKQGLLKCKVVLCTKKYLGRISTEAGNIEKSNHPQPKTSFYKLIDRKNNRSINFATDLYDIAYYFSEQALESCDYIFKRNYETQFIEALPLEIKKKIHPLGLTFGLNSKSRHGDLLFFLGLMFSNLNLNLKLDGLFIKRIINTLKDNLEHWKFTQSARYLEEFLEFSPSTEDIILFQTRCFPREDEKDVQDIHNQRFQLIKQFKNSMKNNFVGGFIPSKIAKERYSDALTTMPTDPQSYLKLVKKAKIVIYTRGLANSPAWKMAEYLSQGKAIISERLTAELPVSLKNEEELLFFNDDKDCVKLAEKLLDNPELIKKLSENARSYFMQNVHPVRNVKRILDFMLKK